MFIPMSDQPNLLPDPAVTLGKLSLSCRAVLSARRIIPASLVISQTKVTWSIQNGDKELGLVMKLREYDELGHQTIRTGVYCE